MTVKRKSGDVVALTSSGAVTKGVPLMVGSDVLGGLFGVAANECTAAGQILQLLTTGEFDLPKDSGEGIAPSAGDLLRWDGVASKVTTEGLGPIVAECTVDATDADATVRARLLGAVIPHGRALVVGDFDVGAGKAVANSPFEWEGPLVPAGFRVVRAWYEVLTTFQSSTDAATIALGFNTDDASGLKAAIAISNAANPWDVGLHEMIQDGAAANFSEKLTSSRKVEILVAVEDLTVGRAVLYLEIAPFIAA